MTGFESFVGIDPWTALFTFCNMMITFAVLKKFLFKPVKKMIVEYTKRLAQALHVIGLINIQFIVSDGEVYIIEVNPRSSRNPGSSFAIW